MNNDTIQSSLHSYIEDEREYAREEVREEARKEIMEIVNNMLNEGMPIKQIAKITRVDLKTIKQLKLDKKFNYNKNNQTTHNYI